MLFGNGEDNKLEYALWEGKKIFARDVALNYAFEREIRKASAQKMLKCADSECASSLVKYCHGEVRGAYFAHIHNENCAYAQYDKNCEPYRNIKLTLFEHFLTQGESIELDIKIFGRHYCPLKFSFSDGTMIAVEFGTSKTTVKEIETLENEYETAGVKFIWLVIGELNGITKESDMFYLKRHLLNKEKNVPFILIDSNCKDVCEYFNETDCDCGKRVAYRNGEIASLIIRNQRIELAQSEAQHRQFYDGKEPYKNKLEIKEMGNARIEQTQYTWEQEWKAIQAQINQQETQVRDSCGIRYVKCVKCGKIADVSKFVEYGGKGSINKGICNDCQRKRN